MILRALTVCLLLLAAVGPAVDLPPGCGLELHVGPEDLDLVTGRGSFTATVTNRGSDPVTLVLPGDGSADGERTPLIEWIYTPRTTVPGGWCGNINVLKPGEVFTLQPGQSEQLGGWAAPYIEYGTYRARMVYTNEPRLEWGGVPLGEHDKREMRRVRRSDRCSVVSNEITVRGYPRWRR